MKKFLPISLFFFVFLFGLPQIAEAKVWINEFSSNGSSDWVEFYNDGDASIDLSGFRLRDGSATNKLDLTGQIDAGGFVVFEWGEKLNNGGDTIKIVLVSDESFVSDQVVYGDSADIDAPASGQTAGRQTNGGGTWVVFASATKGSSNAQAVIAPTVTPEPINTPTPTKAPTPTKTPTPKKTPTPMKAASDSEDDSDAKETTTTAQRSQTATATIPKISGVPTSILGIASLAATNKPSPKVSKKPEEKVLVKSAVATPMIAMLAGAVFCIACGILVFLKKRSKNLES